MNQSYFTPRRFGETTTGASRIQDDQQLSQQLNNESSEQTAIDFRLFDLNELVGNNREFEMFKRFLESHGALNDILCWMDIEAYLRADPNDYNGIEDQARALKRNYLNKKYLFSPKKSPIDAETQNIVSRHKRFL